MFFRLVAYSAEAVASAAKAGRSPQIKQSFPCRLAAKCSLVVLIFGEGARMERFFFFTYGCAWLFLLYWNSRNL